MKNLLKFIIVLFSVFDFCYCTGSINNLAINDPVIQANVFSESDNILAIEIENEPIVDNWKKEDALDGFSGKSYYTWRGDDFFSTATKGLLTYYFYINHAGPYNFRLHNRHDCADHTECNDVWVKLDNAPWIKTYSSVNNRWTWDTNHEYSEYDKQPAQYTLEKGFHTLQISARSKLFSIDKMIFFKNGVKEVNWINADESNQTTIIDMVPPVCKGQIVIDKQYNDGYQLKWFSANDNYRVKGYNLFVNNLKKNNEIIGDTSYRTRELEHDKEYTFSLEAIDWLGNISESKATLTVKSDFQDTVSPTSPALIQTFSSDTTIKLNWIASTDNYGVIAGYNVYLDEKLLEKVKENSYTIKNLKPGTEYIIEVSALDAANNESALKRVVSKTTGLPSNITATNLSIKKGLVYPNPFSRGIQIKLLEHEPIGGHVIIRDIHGKIVFEKRLEEHDNLNLSHLKPGIYLIKLKNNETVVSSLIMKK